jgi:hypothetical protein
MRKTCRPKNAVGFNQAGSRAPRHGGTAQVSSKISDLEPAVVLAERVSPRISQPDPDSTIISVRVVSEKR